MFWSRLEILFGILFAVLTALLAKKLFTATGKDPGTGWLSPARWLVFAAYAAGPFLFHMAKANLDVAYRIMTGRIRPGIVRITPGLRTDFGMTILANSVTLTPGTLSVDVDGNRLYVHCINVPDREPETHEVCSSFPAWIRRIAE